MRAIAIIPAGGKGTRSGSAAPKQYLKLFGKEIIIYTLIIFQQNKNIDEIIIAAENKFIVMLNELKKKYKLTKISKIVKGGNERQDSVYNALKSSAAKDDDLIVIHDAARPFLPQNVLTNAIITSKQNGNAVVCLKAKDTLLKGNQFVESYLDRDKVYYVQTPQIFSYSVLMSAIKDAYAENFIGTDESILVKRMGEKINIVDGSVFNFKITTAEDIELLKRIVTEK